MRSKVREVPPPTDSGDLDELVASPPASPGSSAVRGSTNDPAAIEVRLVEHGRALGAADLGPNGDIVLDLLSRAAALTTDECRALEKEAAWRWGQLIPVPGASMAGARAVALVRGRSEGRSEAIVALEAMVAAMTHPGTRKRTGSRLAACVSNAGLAVLVRDLVESETFETLFGPWREVMHH